MHCTGDSLNCIDLEPAKDGYREREQGEADPTKSWKEKRVEGETRGKSTFYYRSSSSSHRYWSGCRERIVGKGETRVEPFQGKGVCMRVDAELPFLSSP